ncbi:MATE family efflux transporter [Anaeromicropila populeti]|uniref:Putative efflux protein, MATE family n=1 Tax=Anaeromicropila populeti TaxID=37658 RepID=A0A1I6KSJ2_9FIRM|nr:MATE family efflux transporter [Anaeromicropila populeti]SFR94144.1 putative efflux protein, MATE family [Anaeromicropila populeti]
MKDTKETGSSIVLSKEQNRAFYQKVFALVIPMALQNLINVGVTAADVFMLGKVSEVVLSASSLAGQIQFIMTLIFFGITSGAAVLTAQYWGKRDTRSIEKVIGMALAISISAAVLFTAATQLFPYEIMRIFTDEESVIKEGVKYLRIVSVSYVFLSVTMVYLNIIRSIERVMISTIVYLISLLVNVSLNYIFIFGHFGSPKMGIAGAATATLIARIVEFIIVFIYAHIVNQTVKVRIRYLFKFDRILGRDFLVYSLPVIMNELLWGAGTSTNTAIIGHLGSSAVAANSIAQVARQLATIVCFGLCNATAIILGKIIGEQKYGLAEIYAKKFVRLSILFGAFAAACILISRPFILNYMVLSEEARDYVIFMFYVMSYFTAAQAFNATIIVGVLRAGGDTKIGMVIDASTMWGGSILIGALAAFVMKWPVEIVYLFLMSDELIKLPISTMRYKKRIWLKNVTRQM